MHSEHLRNLHPGWVVGGWLVSIAVASGVFIIGVGLGLIGPERAGVGVLVPVTVGVGFFVGGLFVGLRWAEAPVLHGAAITFFSVLVWFAGSLVASGQATGGELGLDRPGFVLGMILLQLVAAVSGGWTGRRRVLRGGLPDASVGGDDMEVPDP